MTDALNTYGLLFGAVLTVLAAGATFFNKRTYVAQMALKDATGDELRRQNTDLRQGNTDLQTSNAALEAKSKEQDKLVEELRSRPDVSVVVKQLSKNHKEVMAGHREILSALIATKGNRHGA